MRRCWLVALVGLSTGCGRLNFDVTNRDSDGSILTDIVIDPDASTVELYAYIKASNTETFDNFGYALALSADGKTLVVSSPQEDGGVAGVNGNQNDNTVSNAGAVFVFVRADTTWVQQAYLKASNPGMIDVFGVCLALSADGNTLVVGASGEDSSTPGINSVNTNNLAPDAGAAYVFVRNGTNWTQQAYVKASTTDALDEFGYSVALSASGDTLVVGARGEASNTTTINGDETNNAAPTSGAVYVFTRTGTAWSQQAYVKASNAQAGDEFGFAVALSGDGNTLAVGAPAEDSAASTINGDEADNSVPQAGAAYVFIRSGTVWTKQAYVKPPSPGFGGNFFARRIALDASGDFLGCSAPGEDSIVGNSGAAFGFRRTGTTWSAGMGIKASNPGDNDQFGSDIVIAGNTSVILVSAVLEDSNATGLNGDQGNDLRMDSGAVYAFSPTGAPQAYAKGLAPSAGDQFGSSLGISADARTKACGMSQEDSAARGIDGDQLDESADASGAVLISYY